MNTAVTFMNKAETLGELKKSGFAARSVKDEMRANLIAKLKSGEKLFKGVLGYEESVVPQIVNSLGEAQYILLGWRWQSKPNYQQ